MKKQNNYLPSWLKALADEANREEYERVCAIFNVGFEILAESEIKETISTRERKAGKHSLKSF